MRNAHFTVILSLMLLLASSVMAQKPTLVSVNSSGTASAGGGASNPTISANGRFVAFVSISDDLVTGYDISDRNVYIRDLVTNETKLVSVNHAGTGSGNDYSGSPAISADGRFVAFVSSASNLVPNDTNRSKLDVFIRDVVSETTTLVSVNRMGTGSGNGDSSPSYRRPVMSADGKFVAFHSRARDLVANDTNGYAPDVFVRDVVSGTTFLASVNRFGSGSGNSESAGASLSDDGRFVAFHSFANNLVASDVNGTLDVFVRDLVMGKTILVSRNSAGNGTGNSDSGSALISGNGRFVAFTSEASDLLVNDANGGIRDVFVRDLVSETTTLASVATDGSSGDGTSFVLDINSDGRFILLNSEATTFAPDNNDPFGDEIFLRDVVAGTTTLVTVNRFGTGSGNNSSPAAVVSDDGRYVAFASFSSNLVPNDLNDRKDVFVRDVLAGFTRLASISTRGGSGNDISDNPSISADGRFVAFVSSAENLVTNDHNFGEDAFVFRVPRPGILRFAVGGYNVNEGKDAATVKVIRTGGSDGQVKVSYATGNGTATAGKDYATANGSLTFANGETSKTFTIPIINDTPDEPNESVNLTLSSPSGGAALGSPKTAILTIFDNDLPPALSINDVTLTEGDAGKMNAVFIVSLSAVSGRTVAVNFATANETAVSGTDYLANSGRLTFNPGQKTKTLTIAVKGDTLREANETFRVLLSAPVNATIADEQGSCAILNND